MNKYTIDDDYNGVRLDKFLRKKLQNTSLSQIFKYIRVGKVKVNNKKSKESYKLELGDIVSLYLPDLETDIEKKEPFISLSEKEKIDIKSSIIYEDENILIYNKKENEVIHKGSGHEYGTVEMLKSYLQNPDFNFVNRIDKLTSGLIIGGKTLPIIRELSEEIRNKDVEKKYFIIIKGILKNKNFTLKSYLKKEETKVVESDVFIEGYKESISRFKVLKYGKNLTLLEGTLKTGRTHQLRVQLSNMGHPILGDTKYNGGKSDQMYLYSYYVNIDKFNIEIIMDIPDTFIKRIDKN